MNKRIQKKKISQRYNYGIELLSGYCELPKDIIINEVSVDLWEIARDLNDYDNDLIVYLDCKAINIMLKYKTGWAGSYKTKIGEC
jgi:hypothetical protein